MPPAFGSQTYWSNRFQANPTPFDWLVPAHSTGAILHDMLQALPPNPNILHIGCGTSDVSLQLRALARNDTHITNVDYANEALALGKQRELDFFQGAQLGAKPMDWKSMDLLNIAELVALVSQDRCFNLVVDKSTLDAVACRNKVYLDQPLLDLVSSMDGDLRQTPQLPDLVLMLHMALVTHPGGQWICISHSDGRFDGMRNGRWAKRTGTLEQLVNDLWTLDRQDELETGGQVEEKDGRIVHRPIIFHHLYVLTRTDKWTSVAKDLS